MSAQILLQGRLLGVDEFAVAAPADRDNRVFDMRLQWAAILGEVLPRALLADLKLSPLMLGSSGGGRFLVILPDEERAATAEAFLTRASESLGAATNGIVRIAWSWTENLGDWTVVRKRLREGARKDAEQLASAPGFFEPFTPAAPQGGDRLPRGLRDAAGIRFSFELPALIAPETPASAEGSVEPDGYRWDLGRQASLDNITLTRHAARNGDAVASAKELAKRAKGDKMWGILRGQIDDFETRMRRAQSVEEHVQLSILYKQFLAGEIELLCSTGDYFQRVTVLRAENDEFAVFGSWDALLGFARELQRVFAAFAEESLKELAGGEAKSLTMALTLAEPADVMARVWEDNARDLEIAKSADKDCLYLLGRVLEWKQMADAAELTEAVVQINEEFRGGRQFLAQLRTLYKKLETGGLTAADQERLSTRALRFQRRFSNVANRKEREFQKLRAHLMKELAGRNLRGRLKLRPEGLVALEWARLATD
jgi:CRISPR-associated protein Csm1